jgi:hypothetical protein
VLAVWRLWGGGSERAGFRLPFIAGEGPSVRSRKGFDKDKFDTLSRRGRSSWEKVKRNSELWLLVQPQHCYFDASLVVCFHEPRLDSSGTASKIISRVTRLYEMIGI